MDVVQLMDKKNVGCVVITEKKKPVGIITDRDVVLRVVAKEYDPRTITVNEVMTGNPMVLSGDMGLFDALRSIRGKTFRRIPVIDAKGRLKGIITLDDLMRLLVKELSCVSTVLEGQAPTF